MRDLEYLNSRKMSSSKRETRTSILLSENNPMEVMTTPHQPSFSNQHHTGGRQMRTLSDDNSLDESKRVEL